MPVNEIAQLEEDIRREKLRGLGQKLLPIAILLAVALILGTAIKSGLHAWKTNKQEDFTVAFAAALDEKDAVKRAATLQALATAYPDAAAAKLAVLAETLAKADVATGLQAVETLAQDRDLPLFYRQMLVIVAARYALDGDAAASRAALADLAPLIDDQKSPWQLQAVFYNAVLRMRQAGEVKEIKDIADAAARTLARDSALLQQLRQLETLYIADRPAG